MVNRIGEVKIWANGEPDNGVNILRYEDIALKTDITWTNSGTNTGDETQAGLLTKLGIPGPYDDNAAALADEVPVGSLYYVTTTLALQTVIAAEA